MFVATNILLSWQNICHDKHNFVVTKVCLSWQNFFCNKHKYLSWQNFCWDKNIFDKCCGKHTFVATKDTFCHDKHMFVVTKLSPMIHTSFYKLDRMLESCTVSIFHLEKVVASQQANLLKEEHCRAQLTKKINTLHNLNEYFYILYWPSHQ